MLFFQSALISQVRLHFLQELKYNSFEKKRTPRKLFWVTVTVNVNADEVKGTVGTLGDSRNKGLVCSTEESPEPSSSVFIQALIGLICDC